MLNCNTTSQYYYFTAFYQIDAALLSIKDLYKHLKGSLMKFGAISGHQCCIRVNE